MNVLLPVGLPILVWIFTFGLACVFLTSNLPFRQFGSVTAAISEIKVFLRLSAGASAMGMVVLISTSSVKAALIAVAVHPLLFLFSLFCQYKGTKKRQNLINRELPLLLDHMVLQIESGHSIQQALRSAPSLFLINSPFYSGLGELNKALVVGRSLNEALEIFRKQLNTAEAAATLSAISQAVQHGTPLSKILREQSKRMRERLILEGEQFANTLSIKILIPLLFFIFPASFLVIFSPVIVSLSEGLW